MVLINVLYPVLDIIPNFVFMMLLYFFSGFNFHYPIGLKLLAAVQ